MNVNKCWWS